MSISLIAPFAVEANHPRNSDLLIQSLTGICERRLRSRISPAVKVIDRNGKQHIKTPVLHGISLPEVDGHVLKVSPKDLTIEIVDPLATNDQQMEEFRRYVKATRGTEENLRACDTVEARLDPHRMKTLCREVLQYIAAGEMEWCDATPRFSLSDVESLEGRFLLNPGSQIPNNQPTFEDEMEAYKEKLLNSGG